LKAGNAKRFVPLLVIAVATVAALASAAAFAVRVLQGSVTVAPATSAKGAACTGFYSSAVEQGIPLPQAGTNYNAPTYGTNSISVTPSTPVCQWTSNSTTYTLYGSLQVNVPVTVGRWYIKDFYGFGYNGTATDPVVYVYLKVESAASTQYLSDAELLVYNATTGDLIGPLDLTSSSATLGPIKMRPGTALQLDLELTGTAQGTTSFAVGFYVTQSTGETPR